MPDMTGIPSALHICDDCKVERTLLAIYYREVKQMEDGA